MALWLLLLLLQPVHLAVLSAGLCPHHVGHHAGQEAGHHVPPTPADQQGDGPPHPVPHLDTQRPPGSPPRHQLQHIQHQQQQVGGSSGEINFIGTIRR